MKLPATDNARVEALWGDLSGPLLGYLRRQTGSSADADDLLQEVFLRIHRHVASLKDTSKLQGWVYQIARHAVIDHARARRKRLPEERDPDTMADGSEPTGRDAVDLTPTLRRFLGQLPPHYREPLIRQEFQGQSLQQIADALGLSLTATKTRVQRARQLLRGMLDECCHFEFDRRGRVIEAIPRKACPCSKKTPVVGRKGAVKKIS